MLLVWISNYHTDGYTTQIFFLDCKKTINRTFVYNLTTSASCTQALTETHLQLYKIRQAINYYYKCDSWN